MTVRIACLLAPALLAVAGRAADPPTPGPADLQGAWELVSVEVDGESNDSSGDPPRLVIRDDQALYGGQEVGRLTADPSATPKVLDLRLSKPDRTLEGIYAVEGRELKVCVSTRADGAKERPQDFTTKGHGDRRLLVFRKAAEGGGEGLRGFVGLQIGPVEGGGGVAVVETLDGSPARAAGLKKGDVVLRVGSRDVSDVLSTVEAVRQAKPGERLTVRIRRDGAEQDVIVKVGLVPFTALAQLD
jgi:uncharacterized protein (TIGR03067 family)